MPKRKKVGGKMSEGILKLELDTELYIIYIRVIDSNHTFFLSMYVHCVYMS